MKATICKDFEAFEAAHAGAILYDGEGALIKCAGCGHESFCEERQGDNHPSWTMDKQVNTWSPSVHHSNGKACGWHGHLVNGEWIPC